MNSSSSHHYVLTLTTDEPNWLWAPKYFPNDEHISMDVWLEHHLKRLSKMKFSTPKQKRTIAEYFTAHVQSRYGLSSEWNLFYVPDLKTPPKLLQMKMVEKRKSYYDDLATSVTGLTDENIFVPTLDPVNTSHLGFGHKAIRQMSDIHKQYNKIVYGWEFEESFFLIEYVEENSEEFFKMLPIIDLMVQSLKVEVKEQD